MDWHWDWKSSLIYVFHWEWTKKLLYWLIVSAGTMSECVFLVASLWMSVNSSVHPFILLFMSEDTSRHIAELATVSYVALPEFIVSLAVVTVIGHIRLYLHKQGWSTGIWVVLYAIPTVVFFVLSVTTLGFSVTSTHFILPEYLVIIRAISAFLFAFTSLLYIYLGKPQEVDRLQEKEDMIARMEEQYAGDISELKRDNAVMVAEIKEKYEAILSELGSKVSHYDEELHSKTARYNEEMERQKRVIEESNNRQMELIKAVNKNSEDALQAYSDACKNWLKSGHKSVSVDDILRYTGHQKRKIMQAIERGILQTTTRNKELIMMASLTEWLKNNPPSSLNNEGLPALHIVNG